MKAHLFIAGDREAGIPDIYQDIDLVNFEFERVRPGEHRAAVHAEIRRLSEAMFGETAQVQFDDEIEDGE